MLELCWQCGIRCLMDARSQYMACASCAVSGSLVHGKPCMVQLSPAPMLSHSSPVNALCHRTMSEQLLLPPARRTALPARMALCAALRAQSPPSMGYQATPTHQLLQQGSIAPPAYRL